MKHPTDTTDLTIESSSTSVVEGDVMVSVCVTLSTNITMDITFTLTSSDGTGNDQVN